MGNKNTLPIGSNVNPYHSKPSTQKEQNIDTCISACPPALSTKVFTSPVKPMKQIIAATSLDTKICNALKELKKKRLKEDKYHTNYDPFTRIMLKFPLCNSAFNSARTAFRELDQGQKGYIVHNDFQLAAGKLGLEFSQEELCQVFEESDMMDSGRLDFKEFLVCLAIGFVLHRIPCLENKKLSIFYAPLSPSSQEENAKTSSRKNSEDKSKSSPIPIANGEMAIKPTNTILFGAGNKLRTAFQLAIDAFLWFDIDGDGFISRENIESRLHISTHSPTKRYSALHALWRKHSEKKYIKTEASSITIWEGRFDEMDWNRDGTIQFKEFLMAFESWVGLDDSEAGYVESNSEDEVWK